MNTRYSSIYVEEYGINIPTPASESLGLLAHCENPIDVSTPATLTRDVDGNFSWYLATSKY